MSDAREAGVQILVEWIDAQLAKGDQREPYGEAPLIALTLGAMMRLRQIRAALCAVPDPAHTGDTT